MKKELLLCTLFLIFITIISTEGIAQISNDSIYTVVDTYANFNGTKEQYTQFLNNNIAKVENKTVDSYDMIALFFVVETNGSISNVRVERSSQCNACDERAIQIVQNMPLWIPATRSGMHVRSLNMIYIKCEELN
ncbi:MAG: energy transducer TonB [Bacteroidales bacterium]|jgi:TonB family protein